MKPLTPQETDKLAKQLEIAKRSLEFYADTENWYNETTSSNRWAKYGNENAKTKIDHGKRAREALREIEAV